MSVRGDFVTGLQKRLGEAFGIPFEDGPIEGPQPDRDVGCVWWERKRPWVRDGNVEENTYRVRVFRRFMQDQGASEPRRTVNMQLLEVAEDLEARLKAMVVGVGHAYFNVVDVSPDYRGQFVEAQLTAYDRNRSATGG